MAARCSFHSCWHNWRQYLGPIENADLADICEVSSAAVTGWLNGSRKPRANKISRLSNFIHELITERKVVIAPHNRSDFTTICTTYQHSGEIPTASSIRASFEGSVTVEQVLGLSAIDSQLDTGAIYPPINHRHTGFLKRHSLPLSVLVIVLLLTGGALTLYRNYPSSIKPLYQHSEIALSMDGEIRKVSISPDGKQRAFLWKPPGSDNFDVYLVDQQQVITPILVSESNELGLAWSPNNNSLALIRITKTNRCEFILFNIETLEERLLSACNRLTHFDFVWSIDGRYLYFTSREKLNRPSAVYSYSFSDGQTRQLTFPDHVSYGDYRIVESISGNKLAFLRSDRWSYSELRTLDLTTAKDELFYQFDQIVYTITWGNNDEEILAVPWQSPNQIESIRADGQRRVITSRSRPISDFEFNAERQEILIGESLYTENILKTSVNLLSDDAVHSKISFNPDTAKPIVISTRSDWQPKLSPDNKTLAFLSNRNGSTELWASNSDGGSARPLTQGDIKGMRIFDWSPDSNKIVVDSSDDRVYVINLATEKIEPYSPIGFVAKNPSWDHDGKKIYIASDSKQAWQIWAIDSALSSPHQITTTGGYHARESSDGQMLLYTRFYHDGIWQLPLNQSGDLEASTQPTNIVKSLKPGAWLQWQLIGRQLYFTERDQDGLRLMKFDLANQLKTKVGELPARWRIDFTFYISDDEKDFYFSEKTNQPGSEYILIR